MNDRIVGYDLARALAVFGMVVVNFKLVMGASDNGPDWLVRVVGGLEGRAAAVFVVLAGVSLSLFSRAARHPGDRQRWVRKRQTLLKRALFLFVAGTLYTPIWPADILHFYGLYIAVAAFLLAAPSRQIWGIAVALVVAFPGLLLIFDYERGWDWNTLHYDGLWTPDGFVRHMLFNGFHPVIPWLAFLLLGMVLGRQDLRNRAVRRRIFLVGATVATIAEFVSRALVRGLSPGASDAEREILEALFGTAPMPPMPLYMLAASGTACAVIAACVAVGERCREAVWLRPLVATGQLALTLYVAHVIVGMGTLESLGYLEEQTLPFSLFASAIFCLTGLLFAWIWRQRFRLGPLEWILRRMTASRRAAQGQGERPVPPGSAKPI